MDKAFNRFQKAVQKPEAFSADDVLDRESIEKLGDGPILSKKRDIKFDVAHQREILTRKLFSSRYDFLYENNRIKSIDVLCRELRDVLANAGMHQTDIHALFRGELEPIIAQLVKYEEVWVPKPEQAREETALRDRLLSTATARFFEATKFRPADVLEPQPVTLPAVEARDAEPPTNRPEVNQNRLYAQREDEAQLHVQNTEERELFHKANRVARLADASAPKPDGDNKSAVATEERTMEQTAMSAETPKPFEKTQEELLAERAKLEVFVAENDARRRAAAAVAEVVGERDTPAPAEKKTGWWDKEFRDAKLRKSEPSEALPGAEEREARSVASLMAQADRLIELTKHRRLGERELQSGETLQSEDDARFSHKEAKLHSDDYKAARSEITKIKNRLRDILADKDVAKKRSEIDELRKSLAGHLWNLRKDFPIEKPTQGELQEVAPTAPALEESEKSSPVAAPEESPLPKTPNVESKSAVYLEEDAVTVTRSDGTKIEAKVIAIGPKGEIVVSWQEDGRTKQEIVSRDNLQHASLKDYVEPNPTAWPEPLFTAAAHEAGADTSYLGSIEAGIEAARERLEEKIAETGTYRNSILAGTESDTLMTLKQRLQTLEERLAAAKKSPQIMTPVEVQAFRSELAEVEYKLNQVEATAPKKVLGLIVPRASDSPFAVRAFRDALNLEWQPFSRVTEGVTEPDVLAKRQAFERMFKILGYIPESGVTDAEANELRALAEQIAMPTRISGTYELAEKIDATPSAETKPLGTLVLTEAMRVREEAAAAVLTEKLPVVANRELDSKKEAKARRWLEGRGGLVTAGILAALFLVGDQNKEKTVSANGGDPYATSSPASPAETAEPTIAVVPDVKPIEGAWPTAEAGTDEDAEVDEALLDTDTEVDATDSEPTITDITDRVEKVGEAAPDYTVKMSDNIWDFAEGDVEGREPLSPLKGLSELQKNLVLSDMVTALKYNKGLMRELGLRSGNPSKIFPGEIIKTQALIDLLNEIKHDRGLA